MTQPRARACEKGRPPLPRHLYGLGASGCWKGAEGRTAPHGARRTESPGRGLRPRLGEAARVYL